MTSPRPNELMLHVHTETQGHWPFGFIEYLIYKHAGHFGQVT